MSFLQARYFWDFKTDQLEWEGLGTPFLIQVGVTGSAWHQAIALEDWGTRLNALLKAQADETAQEHHYKIHDVQNHWLQVSDQVTAIYAANKLVGFRGEVTVEPLIAEPKPQALFLPMDAVKKHLQKWWSITQRQDRAFVLMVIVVNESLQAEFPEAFEHLAQVISASIIYPASLMSGTYHLSPTTWVLLSLNPLIQQDFLARLKHYQSLDSSFPLQDFVWVDHEIIHPQEIAFEAAFQTIDVLVDEGIAYHKRFETIRHSATEVTASPSLSLKNLSHAFRTHQLCLAFQPIRHAKTGETYYESLIRLCQPDGQLLSAHNFINFYESLGLIQTFDQKVLTLVLAELYDNPLLKLSLNVSALTASTPLWLDILRSHLCNRPSVAQRLVVELTETAVFYHLDESVSFLRKLQDLGCQTAIDDFGAGYLSFGHLRKRLADIIKIDGRFIQNLTPDSENLKFIRLVLSLTHPHGLECVAEYVDAPEIATLLTKEGVDYLQGYHIGRPQFLRPIS